jgi:hypothetical protein
MYKNAKKSICRIAFVALTLAATFSYVSPTNATVLKAPSSDTDFECVEGCIRTYIQCVRESGLNREKLRVCIVNVIQCVEGCDQ